jgi:hypothetical protein
MSWKRIPRISAMPGRPQPEPRIVVPADLRIRHVETLFNDLAQIVDGRLRSIPETDVVRIQAELQAQAIVLGGMAKLTPSSPDLQPLLDDFAAWLQRLRTPPLTPA